ncbi:hypothetical protein LLG95_17095 [bacterium]|nr:hypothetical protein [bacterium]
MMMVFFNFKALTTGAMGLALILLPVGAAAPYLVKDINQNMNTAASSSPGNFLTIGSVTYFTADDGVAGNELYKTDGTEAGTFLVKDIIGGISGSSPRNLTEMNGLLYFFSASNLYVSDGTAAGTTIVKGMDASHPPSNMIAGSWLYFVGYDSTHGYEYWTSSGSSGGTYMSRDINSGTANSSPQNLTYISGSLYCSAIEGSNGREVYQGNPPYLLKDINPGSGSSNPSGFTLMNSKVYFSATDATGLGLWSTYGSSYSTNLVKSGFSELYDLISFNSKLFFSAKSTSTGDIELWSSDGTDAGTTRFKDLEPGDTNYSRPIGKSVIGSTMYFLTRNETNGLRLWKSDGTAAGTVAIATLSGYSANESVSCSTRVLGGKLVLFCNTLWHGYTIWTSDGTPAGTTKIFTSASDFTSVGSAMPNGLICFTGEQSGHGKEPWVTDGTAAGTHVLKELAQTPVYYEFKLTAGPGRVYFTFSESAHGEELWCSDATEGGTYMVKDINAGTTHSLPRGMTSFRDRIYFTATDGSHGRELWSTDGTLGGTSMYIDLRPGAANGVGDWCFAAGTKLYFQGTTAQGSGLYCIDGIAPGTATLLASVQVYNPTDTTTKAMSDWNGNFFFNADDGVHGYELWISDGTPAGTHMVTDMTAGTAYFHSLNQTPIGSRMFFTFNKNNLAVTDGTEQGTRLIHHFAGGSDFYGWAYVKSIAQFNNSAMVLLKVPDFYDNFEFWRSDGTSETTTLLRSNREWGAEPQLWVPLNGYMYFANSDQTIGSELWRSDGTTTGTAVFNDIYPGVVASQPEEPCLFNNRIYFRAAYPGYEFELWSTDGTLAGTQMVADIMPGDGLSWPRGMTVAGQNLFFIEDDGVHGEEIWVLPKDDRAAETVSIGTGDTAPVLSATASMGIDFSANSIAGQLTMAHYNAMAPGRTSDVPGYWIVSGLAESTFGVVLTFNYDPAAVTAAGLSESNLRLIRSTDGGRTWSEVAAVVDEGANTIRTASAQSSLGMYAISAADRVPGMEIWVNFYWNNFEAGTALDPFNTLLEGVAAVSSGGKIKINAGTTSEHVRITKPMRIETVGGTARIGGN